MNNNEVTHSCIRSTPAIPIHKMAGETPIVPAQYSQLPFLSWSVPKCGSPLASNSVQLPSEDIKSPSKLSLKSPPVVISVSCIDVKVMSRNVNIP